MNIREKSLLIGGATVVSFVGAVYVLTHTFLLGTFEQLGRDLAQESMQQLRNGVQSDIDALDAINADWAGWDDTCAFMAGMDDGYEAKNLIPTTFTTLELGMMVFVNTNGVVRWGHAFDRTANAEELQPLPDALWLMLAPGQPLVTHTNAKSGIHGLIAVGEWPMEVSSRPILTSQAEGPVRGSLIMGRYLDDARIARLTRWTGIEAQTLPWARVATNPRRAELTAKLTAHHPIAIHERDADIADMALRLDDVEGNPCAAILAWRPRYVYQAGLYAIRQFTVLLCVGGLLIGLVAFLVLEREVLRRLSVLHRDVAQMHRSGDIHSRLPADGRDEVAGLAAQINRLLGRLQAAQREQEDVNAQLERRIAERTQELSTSRAELQALYRHMEEVREHERRQLASRVHDDLGQMLTALKMGVEWVSAQVRTPTPAFQARLKEMVELAESLTRSVQDLSSELRPAMLDHLGLQATLEWHARRFMERSGIDCELHLNSLRLPSGPMGTLLFRIYQELLTNVARHAKAERVVIRLEQEGDEVVLVVRDDGCGIKPEDAQNPGSFGLSAVRERVAILKGRLTISGTPGQGTRVVVRVPLGNPPEGDPAERKLHV